MASAQVATDRPPVVAGAAKVRVDAITVHSPSVAGNLEGNPADREVYVVLPPSYDEEPSRHYPVIYACMAISSARSNGWAKFTCRRQRKEPLRSARPK